MADPAFIQELQMVQTMNYLTAAGGALVAYDQVITFSQEVDHIWNRKWSFVTALYLIARYSGSLSLVGAAAWDMCINWSYSGFVDMYLAYIWAENIFLLTMQAILVIRVYALFNQSKKLLIFLATFYALQATAVFVLSALEFNNRAQLEYVASVGPAIGSVVQDVSVNSSSAFLRLGEGSTILSVVFDTVLLFFSLWAFVRHTFEAKTLNGGWSINLLVRTLVADHLVYFVCYLIWLSLSLATTYVTEATVSNAMLDMLYVFNALAAVAGPRMVIGLRAMENKTRGEGGTLEGEVSTIRFGVREPPTQSVSVMEQGDEFRATDENV